MTVYRRTIPFSARFVPHILGTELPLKTVTRRFTPHHVGEHLRAAVPKPGKKPSQWKGFANLVVVGCESWRLHDIALNNDWMAAELRREGVETADEFIAIWRELYDAKPPEDAWKKWDANPPVWRIEFRVEP